MENEILLKLKTFIAAEILRQPERSLTAQDALLSSGLVDSFHIVELALFIEDAFGVILDDAELTRDTFDTLGQLGEIVQVRLEAA